MHSDKIVLNVLFYTYKDNIIYLYFLCTYDSGMNVYKKIIQRIQMAFFIQDNHA